MKPNDIKRRLSTLFTSTNAATLNLAELQKQELESEVTKVQQMLTFEYTTASRSNTRENGSNYEEERHLKSTLNRLRSENKAKEIKASGLLDLINCYSVLSPRFHSSSGILTSNLHESQESSEFKQQLLEEEAKIDEELINTEILVESKAKALKNGLIWKEKLYGLSRLQRDVEKKYAEVIDTKQKAMLSLATVQSHLSRMKKFKEMNEVKFKSAIGKWRNSKKKYEDEAKESISKISRVNLKSRETRVQRERIIKKLEEKIELNARWSDQVRVSKEEIGEIRRQLQLIKGYIPDCPALLEPLTEENVDFIIVSYSKLKFQEHSLSVKFQNLTEEQLEKQHRCDMIKEELNTLKAYEKSPDYTLAHKGLTFNQIKATIESDALLQSTKLFEDSQRVLMKLYLQLINLSTLTSLKLGVIGQKSHFHFPDNSFLCSFNILQKAQQGFTPKHAAAVNSARKKTAAPEVKKTFKTEVESLEQLQSFSVSLIDIEEILSRYIHNSKLLSELAYMLKGDVVSCLFIEIPELEAKLVNLIGSPQSLIVELNRIGNRLFVERFLQIEGAISEILLNIKAKFYTQKAEIAEFYKKNNVNMTEIFEKAGLIEFEPGTVMVFSTETKPKTIGLEKSSKEIPQKFKVLDTAKTVADDKSDKKRQEIPTKSESSSSVNSKEIISELNSIKLKVSELRSLERKLNSVSNKNLNVDRAGRPWLGSGLKTSTSSRRPLTVDYLTKREKITSI